MINNCFKRPVDFIHQKCCCNVQIHEVVASCINEKESSLIPTSDWKNSSDVSTECFMTIFFSFKLVSENSPFHVNSQSKTSAVLVLQ